MCNVKSAHLQLSGMVLQAEEIHEVQDAQVTNLVLIFTGGLVGLKQQCWMIAKLLQCQYARKMAVDITLTTKARTNLRTQVNQ